MNLYFVHFVSSFGDGRHRCREFLCLSVKGEEVRARLALVQNSYLFLKSSYSFLRPFLSSCCLPRLPPRLLFLLLAPPSSGFARIVFALACGWLKLYSLATTLSLVLFVVSVNKAISSNLLFLSQLDSQYRLDIGT